MATATLVLSDDSTLSKLDRSFLKVERVLALMSGLAVFALMLQINIYNKNKELRTTKQFLVWQSGREYGFSQLPMRRL